MTDELLQTPFERRNAGPQGAILLRVNREHEKRCIVTIRFREHPAWSQHNCPYRIEEAA